MKKSFIIPSLLLACSLTACNDGLVTKGVAYTDGVTAKVNETIKNEKKGSFKEIVVNSKAITKISLKFNGETSDATGDATSTIKINLDEKTVEISMENVAKSGKTKKELKGSVKVKKVNNTYERISSKGDANDLFKDLDYGSYFTFAEENAYSWNFSFSDAEIQQALASVSANKAAGLESAVKSIKANMLIDGDPEKGNVRRRNF